MVSLSVVFVVSEITLDQTDDNQEHQNVDDIELQREETTDSKPEHLQDRNENKPEHHQGDTHQRGENTDTITGFDAEARWPLNGHLSSPFDPLYSLMGAGVSGLPLSLIVAVGCFRLFPVSCHQETSR